jgi:RNA polymerase sigma factor (sigma-70 family)
MDTTDACGLDGADMQRLAAGHEAALNDLMARHGQPVFHFLCRMLGNEGDANDLAQETFVRVYQHRASFRPGAKFTTWLYTIAAATGAYRQPYQLVRTRLVALSSGVSGPLFLQPCT